MFQIRDDVTQPPMIQPPQHEYCCHERQPEQVADNKAESKFHLGSPRGGRGLVVVKFADGEAESHGVMDEGVIRAMFPLVAAV